MFAWLGSGRAKRNGVAPAGCLLDEATRAHLPVPNGAVILDLFYRLAQQEGWVTLQNGRLIFPAPQRLSDALYQSIRFPRFDRPVLIRPVHSQATAQTTALPTPEESFIAVPLTDANDPQQLAAALGRSWSAADPLETTWRRDTLIMEMIQVAEHGTAVTSDNSETDTVYYPSPTAQQALDIPKLSGWQRPNERFAPHLRRLQQLLRGIRRTFGRGAWAIEWADDGEICWLMTIYPTTIEEL